MFKLLLVLLCLTKESYSTLTVYRHKKTKNDAELFCERIGGALLSYSAELLDASRHCAVADVLTNKPWLVYQGCYHIIQTSNRKKFTPNHLAECAQYCSGKSFAFIGVQADNCLCYDSLVGVSPAGSCDSVTCPGNPMEQCGVVHMIVYRKVNILSSSGCQYVEFGSNTFQLKNGDCDSERNYICKDSSLITNIECIGPSDTTTTEPEGLAESSTSNLGLILGITIGVLVLIVLILAVVYFKMRRDKKLKEDRLHMQPRQRGTHHETDDEFINAFREPPGYHNVDVRDRTPQPIIAFGGEEGVDLDRAPIPVYTAVHKKPAEHTPTGKKIHSNMHSHEPAAYDEVYQPSAVGDTNRNNVNTSVNRDNKTSDRTGFQNKPYNNVAVNNRSSSVDKSNVGVRRPEQKHRSSRNQNGVNEHVHNELLDNKLFRNSQNRQESIRDDDLY